MLRSIKTWYCNTFPEDELGCDISDSTFFDLITDLPNAYDVIGVGDSVVRERVFDELARICHVDYEDIYNKWLRK